MIAALPMYWFAETRAAHTAFWSLVRDRLKARGVGVPDALDETAAPYDVWGAPGLALSHICNLPYRKHFRDRLTRIGASDYGLEGCGPGQYRSLFVVRSDHPAGTPEDLDGATMAINADESHSGWGDAATWADARGMRFRPVAETGSHRNSIVAVAEAKAEFATIDARSFEILRDVLPETRRLRVIGATPPSPGMTFVTRHGEDPAPYLDALRHGIEAIDPRHRRWLGLRGINVLPDEAYDIPLPPDVQDWRE